MVQTADLPADHLHMVARLIKRVTHNTVLQLLAPRIRQLTRAD